MSPVLFPNTPVAFFIRIGAEVSFYFFFPLQVTDASNSVITFRGPVLSSFVPAVWLSELVLNLQLALLDE